MHLCFQEILLIFSYFCVTKVYSTHPKKQKYIKLEMLLKKSVFYPPCLSSFKKCYTSLFYSIFQFQCLHKYMTPFSFIPFSFFIIIQFMKYVSSIHIFSIGGSQTLPIKSEQWNGGEYGSVQVKCTNIAGKTL